MSAREVSAAARVESSALQLLNRSTFNPFEHPIVFSVPRRLTPYSSWHGHIPFAMYLVSLLRPNVIVELGTQGGDSFCAFCQAVRELNLDTRCYAVDSWQGDAHGGYYGPQVLNDLRAHHDPLYGTFSQLIVSTFTAARDHFADSSIDLLHLDGYHTYQAAREDIETWLCKLSPRGVVLLHDVNARERDFGVWRVWEELAREYPHWAFYHGYGLGVLAVGPEAAAGLGVLLNASPDQASLIRNFFFRLAQGLPTPTDATGAPTLSPELRQIETLSQELQAQARVNESVIAQLALKEQREQNLLRELQAHQAEQTRLAAEKTGLEQSMQALVMERNAVREQVERAALTDQSRTAALQQTLDAQTQHLDALGARLERMTLRENELRTMLLEAQAQLWDRDQELDRLVAAASPLSPQTESLEFLENQVTELNQIIAARDQGILWLRSELADARNELGALQNSRFWRLRNRYWHVKNRLLALFGAKS